MAVEVIRTIASWGSSIFGSGTESTRTSPVPCQQSAFMGVGLMVCCDGEHLCDPCKRQADASSSPGVAGQGAPAASRRGTLSEEGSCDLWESAPLLRPAGDRGTP